MASSRPAGTRIYRARIRRRRVAGLLAAIAFVAVLGQQLLGTSSPTSPARDRDRVRVRVDAPRPPLSEHRAPPADLRGALGVAGGAVPDGTTVFADEVPGVARLHPALLAAVRRAAAGAAGDGITFVVESGWRSPEYQRTLLAEAIAEHGSRQEAARWVASPDRSAHVAGYAIDIGPRSGAAWLARRGAAYGLCQTYGNEPWHFELRPKAPERGCPAPYPDPTHDPRLR